MPTPVPKVLRPRMFMSIIPGRRPREKSYASLAQAKGSVSYHIPERNGAYWDMAINELVDGEWTLLYDIPRRTLKDEVPWKDSA